MKKSESDEENKPNNQKDVTPVSAPNARSSSFGHLTSAALSHNRLAPVDTNEGQRRSERKNNKNTTINQIFLLVIPNTYIGPVAGSGDGGEMAEDRQRDPKRRSRKHKDLAELT